MRKKISGEKVEKSSFFRSAKDQAYEYAKDPKKLIRLLDRATRKAISGKGPLAEIHELLLACIRLLRAYAGGQYRDIPWESLIPVIAAIVYFVMPIDLIPDFILAFGLIDDAALLGWVLSSLKKDIDHFIDWEKNNQPPDND